MKIKILLLSALMSYGSISNAFTLYSCKSVDTNVNQTLKVTETASRAPSEDITVTLTNEDKKGSPSLYYVMYPKLTKTNSNVTVNTFTNSKAELKIITKLNLPLSGSLLFEGVEVGQFCGRGPCPELPKNPKLPHLPNSDIISTLAILITDSKATFFQCND